MLQQLVIISKKTLKHNKKFSRRYIREDFFLLNNIYNMKKTILVIAMAVISLAGFSQSDVMSTLKFGVGGTLGGIDADFGVHGRALVNITDEIDAVAGFSLFFPGTTVLNEDLDAWQIQANVHYKFHETDGFTFYGLGGINYIHTKRNALTENEIGFDIGGGAEYKKLFGELKYDTSFEQLTVTVGIYF